MKKRIISFFVLMGILVCANVFAATSAKEVFCYPLVTAPVIDGKIDGDKAWKNIPKTDGNFIIFGTDSEISKKKTYFRTGYDSASLFIAIECEEPDLKKIVSILYDEENVWSEDSVEVFIMPRTENEYFQFVTNAIGSRYNGISRTQVPLMEWQAKTSMGNKMWSAEIRIPFSTLDEKPKKGESWGFNVCRNIYSVDPIMNVSWATMFGSFHEPENFGKITFK